MEAYWLKDAITRQTGEREMVDCLTPYTVSTICPRTQAARQLIQGRRVLN